MGYAIAGVLVLLVIAALITLLVLRATRARGSAGGGVDGPGIGADDETPWLDTREHAGDQEGGETVAGADAGKHGGAGRRTGQGYTGTAGVGDSEEDRHAAAQVQRPGEGEGAQRL